MLSNIKSPKKLKEMTNSDLVELASEIREYLIEVVSKTGGHLAPNLGVVELTLAIHYILDAPKDKIIWDVGHQSYVHKLLTGRCKNFDTLRQYEGICGFPNRFESEYDVFSTGHASNSISVALGLAKARDMRDGEETILAVIGDGSLTGGEAYEALNQAGHLGTDLIVILNDNEMSIASNVGAIAQYLNRIRLDPMMNKIRTDFEERLKKIPTIGPRMFQTLEGMKDGIKHIFVSGMIFEELGFKYIGPIDGHNIDVVAKSIKIARQLGGPVMIHAYTQKGKGYNPAEKHTEKFHGISPFDIKTGNGLASSDKLSYMEVFGKTMIDLADMDERIVAVTAAMRSGTGLVEYSEKFPDRFYDVGIAEQHAITFSAGLALGGYKPVAAIYSTFLQRAFDQVILDICLQKLHVVISMDRSGLVGEDGPTHHGAFDLSYLREIPNLSIMAPADENELRQMLYTAVLKMDGAIAIRYPRGTGPGVICKDEFSEIPYGRAKIVQNGQEIALIAVGRMVEVARMASLILENELNFKPSIINARFVKPLPESEIKKAALEHELLVTLEDNSIIAGFGSSIVEFLNDESIKTEILRIGLPDQFIPHGSVDKLYKMVGMDAESVSQKVIKKYKKISGQ